MLYCQEFLLQWNAGENWLELVEEELRGRELDIGNMKTFPPYFTWWGCN